MIVTPGPFSGLLRLEPDVHLDHRGQFVEIWHAARYRPLGLPEFVQANLVHSHRGVLRGLHFQHPHDQAKLVWAASGSVYDVVVDVRAGSPTYGKWSATTLSASNGWQLFIPHGFAHGYQVVSDGAVVGYHCDDYYHPDASRTVLWSDPDLAISWPIPDPVVIERDRAGARLRDIGVADLPRYAEPAR